MTAHSQIVEPQQRMQQSIIGQEETYPLLEAQMDRFLMHVMVGYSSEQDEAKIIRLVRSENQAKQSHDAMDSSSRIPQQAIFAARREIDQIESAESIDDYLVALMEATRDQGRFGEDLKRWIHVGVARPGHSAVSSGKIGAQNSRSS